MAHQTNYGLCTSRPPTYSPISDIGNSASGQCSDITIIPASCAVEMMTCGSSISSAAIAGRLQHPKLESSRSPVSSILYNLLNVRAQKAEPSTSSSSCGTLDSQIEGMSEATECRNRSDSLGSAVCIKLGVISRTPSGGSLASSSGYADNASWNQSEELVEDARTRLVQLSTNTDASLFAGDLGSCSHSQPGTPPSPVPLYAEQRRKYSVGSRLAQLSQQQTLGDVYVPVDLSCKRSRYCGSEKGLNSTAIDSDDSSCSILKSVLSVSAPGVRRNTVSVCSQRGLLTARRRHVTLAKKAFFPVSARIAEQLKRVVKFALSLPEFCSLPVNDQLALLTSACPRLLLLYMAEVNLQFAVTSMHESGSAPTTLADCYDRVPSPAETELYSSSVEWPTMQFVENTQNFIRKCQQLQIQQNEYFYMRMITLFHTENLRSVSVCQSSCSGSSSRYEIPSFILELSRVSIAGSAGSLERPEVAERLGAEARQDLQKLAQHYRPSERMRYSALLLTLHTLYGVHCGMLASLFCRQLLGGGNSGGGIGDFFGDYVRRELSSSTVTADDCS